MTELILHTPLSPYIGKWHIRDLKLRHDATRSLLYEGQVGDKKVALRYDHRPERTWGHQLLSDSHTGPRLLEKDIGARVTLVEWLPGQPLAPSDTLALLATLQRLHKHPLAALSGAFVPWVEYASMMYRTALERLLGFPCMQRGLTAAYQEVVELEGAVVSHGDMTPDNTVMVGESAFLIDPECHYSPVDWDIVTWVLRAFPGEEQEPAVVEYAVNVQEALALWRFRTLTYRAYVMSEENTSSLS